MTKKYAEHLNKIETLIMDSFPVFCHSDKSHFDSFRQGFVAGIMLTASREWLTGEVAK